MPAPFFTVLAATGFTFFMTAAGASIVFLFSKETPDQLHRFFLGFAAGVMIAASIWSLLLPSIEQASMQSIPAWLPAAGGFLLGVLFLLLLEQALPSLTGRKLHVLSNFLLIFSIALHNVPEGMAVGLAEPRFDTLTVFISNTMPWLLSFAAGAMIYVSVKKLIPEAHSDNFPSLGTIGFLIGFLFMMILDVALA